VIAMKKENVLLNRMFVELMSSPEMFSESQEKSSYEIALTGTHLDLLWRMTCQMPSRGLPCCSISWNAY